MSELQAGISYWLSVSIRTVQTFPSFIGNNWVGVLLSFALLLPATRQRVKEHLAEIRAMAWSGKFFYTGRTLMQTNWRTVIIIIGAFLFGNFLTVGFRDYASATNQTKSVGEQLSTVKSQLAASAVNCQLQTNDIRTARDVEQGKNQILQDQNRAEQVLVADCQNQAIKRLTPEPLTITPLTLDVNDSEMGREVKWLVLTNKTLTPVTLRVTCTEEMQDLTIYVMGAAAIEGGADKLSATEWRYRIVSPAWSPTSPVVAVVSTRTSANNVLCSFSPR